MTRFRPSSLRDITWRRDPAPASPAMDSAADAMRLAMTQEVNRLVKTRARRMLNGELPIGFCERAAAIVARLNRIQVSHRRAA